MGDNIRTIAFDLETASESAARRIQNRVGDFSSRYLNEVLEACLTEFADADTVYRFDRIELELGKLSEQDLENKLAERIGNRLRDYLAARIPAAFPRQTEETPLQADEFLPAPLAELSAFLLRGILAVNGKPAPNPDRLLSVGLDRFPLQLKRLLRNLGKRSAVRKRLASQVSTALLSELVRLLEPDHHGLIIEIVRNLGRVLGAGEGILSERASWEFMLADLLAERGSHFDPQASIASVLRQMAGRYALADDELIERFSAISSGSSPALSAASLKLRARGLEGEGASRFEAYAEQAKIPAIAAGAGELSLNRRRLQRLALFLEWGVSLVAVSPQLGMDGLLLDLIRQSPDELLYLVRRIGRKEPVRKRLAGEFSELAIKRLVGLLEPVGANLVCAYVGEVLRVHSRRALVQQETRVFGKVVWEFVLTFLLVDRGSRFNARSFVKSTLTRMAARYRISYDELLQSLIACAQSFHLPVSQKYTLPAVLLSLQEEANLVWIAEDAEASASLSGEGRPGAHSELDVLVYWLGHGVLPAWNPLPKSMDLRHLFSRLSAQNPQSLVAALYGFEGDQAVLARLAGILGESAARRLLHQLAPADGEIILEFLDILQAGGRIRSLPGLDHAALAVLLRELVFGFLLAESGDFRLEVLVVRVRTELDRRFRSTEQALAGFWSATLEAIRRRSPPSPRLETALTGLQTSALSSAKAAPSVALELERLLMHGVPPRVLRGGSDQALAAWLAMIGDTELIAILHRIGAREIAVRRMVWQLPEVFYFRVIELLAGADAGFVQTLRQGLESLAGRGDLQPQVPASFFRQVREYLLASLLNPADRPMLQPERVRRLVWALATRYGTGFHRLLHWLAQADTALEPICLNLADSAGRRRLDDGQTRKGENRLPDPTDSLAGLMLFLETGYFDADFPDAPQRWLAEALSTHQHRLMAALKNGKPAVLFRLLHYLPEGELARLVQALSYSHAEFILGFLSLGSALETADDFPPGPRRRVKHVHWQVVLAALLDPHAPGFTERGFIAETSRLIAQRLSVSLALYTRAVLHIARDRAEVQTRFLPVVEALSQIQSLADPVAKAPPAPKVEAMPFEGLSVAEGFTEALSALRHFLQYGRLPESGSLTSWQALAERFEQEWPSYSVDYRKLLLGAASREPERLRMAKFFPQTLLPSVLALLLSEQNEVAEQALNALDSSMPGLARNRREAIVRDELLLAIHRRAGRRFDWGLYFRDVLRRLAIEGGSDSLESLQTLRQTITGQAGGAREVLLRALDRVEREIVLDCDLEYFAGRDTPDIAESDDEATGREFFPPVSNRLGEAAPQIRDPTAILSAFGHFLQQGHLSPSCGVDNLANLAQCVLSEWGGHNADYRRLLLWATGRGEGRARLLEMFPPVVFHSLLVLLLPQGHELVELVFDAVEGASSMVVGSSPRRWRLAAMDEWLLFLHRQGERDFELAAFLRVLPHRLVADLGVKEAELCERLRREILLQASPRRGLVLRALNDCEPEKTSARNPVGLEAKRQNLPLRSRESVTAELPENEAFYLDNAGMVLLWPFLSRYFQMLGLLERGAFRNFPEQCRAVYLLEYLVSAEEEAPEYRLLLNKILCGIETSLPLEHQGRLTDDERRLSEELLYGVTRNWSKLHHTSIAGLREAFLQREGRLVRKEEGWTLTVSQKSYDILLDTLPWNLSMIKLGWMQTLLQVKWR